MLTTGHGASVIGSERELPRRKCGKGLRTLFSHRLFRFGLIAQVVAVICLGQTQSNTVSVVSAGDYRSYVAPDSHVALFGAQLADVTAYGQPDSSGQFPVALGGTGVQVCGESAGIVAISPTQVNIVIPADLIPGFCQVVVTTSGRTNSGTADIRPVAPTLFSVDGSGTGRAAALNAVTFAPAPFQVITPQNVSSDKGTRVSLFGTGFRNAVSSALPGTNYSTILLALITDANGRTVPVSVEYAGPAPGLGGIDQVNVALPAELDGAGVVFFTLIAGSIKSNIVSLDIAGMAAPAIATISPIAGPPGSGVAVVGSNLGTKEMLAAGRIVVSLVQPNGLRVSLAPDTVDPSQLSFTAPTMPSGPSSLYYGPSTVCVRVDALETCTNGFTLTKPPIIGSPGQTFLSVSSSALQNATAALNQLGANQMAQSLSARLNASLTSYADLVNSALSGNPKSISYVRSDGTQATAMIDAKFISQVDELAAILQPYATGAALTPPASSVNSKLQPNCLNSNEQSLQAARDTLHAVRAASRTILQTSVLSPVTWALSSCVGATSDTCISSASDSIALGEATASLLSSVLYYPLLATMYLELQPLFLDSIELVPSGSVPPAPPSSSAGPTVTAMLLPLLQSATLTVQGHLVSIPPASAQSIVAQATSDGVLSLTPPTAGSVAISKCDACSRILAACQQCAPALQKLSATLRDDLTSLITAQVNPFVPTFPTTQAAHDVQLTAGTVVVDPAMTNEVQVTNACSNTFASVNGLRSTAGGYEPFQFTVDPGVLLLSNEIPANALPGSVSAILDIAVGPAVPPVAVQTDKGTYTNRDLAYVTASGFPRYSPVAISLSIGSFPEKIESIAFTDSGGALNTFVPLHDAQQAGTYTLSAFVLNSALRARTSISIGVARLPVQVIPGQGRWNSSPQVITVRAPSGQRIYYSVNRSVGSSSVAPPAPSQASNDGVITGEMGTIELDGVAGQLTSWTFLFVGEDANGLGSISSPYSYSIDLRTTVTLPQISSIITTPAAPIDGQTFTFLVNGANFDSSTVRVVFNGPGCLTSCVVANVNLSKSSTQVLGSIRLSGGKYSVTVKNGSDVSSNTFPLTVAFGVPAATTILTSPAAPVRGKPFDFTVLGTGFDPGSAIVVITGPGCPLSAKCIVLNSALWSKSSTQLSGTATLGDGVFSVSVQNGLAGTPSGGLTLSIIGARINTITTSPSPPVAGQFFTFTINGTNLDPGSAMVTFIGPGCTTVAGCTIPTSLLSAASPTQLSGVAVLGGGSFQVTVQNGTDGSSSNTLALTVTGSAFGVPQLTTISTAPNPPVAGQAFTFTITGANFDPNSAIVAFNGPGCSAPTPCTIPNISLSSKSTTQLTGTTILTGGAFTVTVQNGATGTPSSGLALTVSGTIGGGPVLTAVSTSPSSPLNGQTFIFTITGTGFDPSTAFVSFSGPGCSPTCVVANNQLGNKTSTSLSGVTSLTTAGAYTVTVQNGSAGIPSNTLSLVIAGSTGAVQITNIATLPNPAVNGQTFSFTITGSGFDPNTALVTFTGPGCAASACTVTNGQLSNRSTTQVSGAAVLAAGRFTVTVQNGSPGAVSNGLQLNVAGTSGAAPQLTAISTSPGTPIGGQVFTFTITGSGFDPNNASVYFSGPGCGATVTCTVDTFGLLSASSTQLTGTALLPAGTFVVTVVNGLSTTPSNHLNLLVSVSAGTGPQITAFTTSPTSPSDVQTFTFTITGTGIDPNTVFVIINGPGCTPCNLPNASLTTKTSTDITASETLLAGTYVLTIQNGPSGASSNGVSLIVSGGTGPHISSISTNPSQPAAGQSFNFTITGTGFDPSTVLVSFTGTGCSPCTVTNSALPTKTSTQLIGSVSLANGGTFTVTVQNGSSGSSSNGQQITVSASAAAPQLSSITTSPTSPLAGQVFNFTLSGSGFDSTSVQVSFSGPGCTPCTVTNGSLTGKSSTQLTGSITITSTGTFTVTAQNGATGTASNSLSISVASAGGTAPQLTSITTSPTTVIAGQSFSFTLSGSGFNTASIFVSFSGPGCTPCTVSNTSLTKTSTQLNGTTTLPTGGSYTVSVQNGSTGSPSNTVSLNVSSGGGGTPQISTIATSPTSPVAGQSFTFTITGTGFDPNTALVSFSGPTCTPCTVPNASLTSKTATQLMGTATLSSAGTFTVTTQNGSSGTASNGQQITVSASGGGGGPQLTTVSTTPNPPVAGQQFSFILTGTGFDPSTVLVTITGTGCSPCTISHTSLTGATSSQVSGTTSLTAAGSYTIIVQNGASGTPSNSQTITVSSSSGGGGGPQLTAITTIPTPPNHTSITQFILFGSGFDATSSVIFNGPGCSGSSCTIPSGDLLVNGANNAIGGAFMFPQAGSYTVKVQNGPTGTPSNTLPITVQ